VQAIIGDRPKIASRTPRTDPFRSNYLCQPVTLGRGHNTRHLLNAEKHSNSQCRRLGLDALLCTYSSRMAYSGHHELPEKQGTNKDSKTPRRASAIYERVPFLVQGYCCPTAAKSSIILLGAVIFLLLLQVKRRADERTRTAYPCSLRVMHQALQGFAEACKSRISRAISFLCLAACCTVLRSRWYQSGIKWLGVMQRGH
jgi:hypothetical protein